MAETTIYDPIAKRRLSGPEEGLARSFANAALIGIMSRSASELETLTPDAIAKIVWRQALSMVETRRKLTNMNDVFKN